MAALAWDDTLSVLIPALAIVPAFIAVAAYRRTPTLRVALFAAAFVMLFVKGVVIALEVLVWTDHAALDAAELLAEAAVVVLFTLGILKA